MFTNRLPVLITRFGSTIKTRTRAKAARENEALQRLEKVVVIVNRRLEIMRHDRQRAIGKTDHLDDGCAYFFQCREHLAYALCLGLFRWISGMDPPTREFT